MSLILRNAQRAVPLRRAPLRFSLDIARSCLKVRNFDLGIICVSNARIRHINRVYRGQDSVTDVLSFPFHEDLNPSLLPIPASSDEYNLGDIYLGVEFIYQQCQKTQEDYSSILTVSHAGICAVHGLCHLLGHQHNNPEQWKQQMLEKETEILKEINRVTGSKLTPLSTNHY
ncbi:endoribonuclease YbeY isoform X1 [Xenopus tropicalis]|uniref:Endoribonuclease YbeY isoform X1 n=1 Tax=Xenopus tropicalis TaxID=8364 RepID=A0A8J0SNX7_XENTR|nr:endoribonuclease YbeY isoform X1 [Xenopus tropicalis]|eukprot:XP_012826367.1 PREDICTED: putative ribonuclease isoform X1 [Xenopus tropicalis]